MCHTLARFPARARGADIDFAVVPRGAAVPAPDSPSLRSVEAAPAPVASLSIGIRIPLHTILTCGGIPALQDRREPADWPPTRPAKGVACVALPPASRRRLIGFPGVWLGVGLSPVTTKSGLAWNGLCCRPAGCSVFRVRFSPWVKSTRGKVTLLPVAPQGVPLHPKSESPTLARRALRVPAGLGNEPVSLAWWENRTCRPRRTARLSTRR